jgi:rhodanese-related sulfurtransferase
MHWRALFSKVQEMSPSQVKEYIQHQPGKGFQLVDVRQPGEYGGGHLPGALLIPLKELPGRLPELDPQQPTIVYCAVGGRSLAAAQFLQGQGFAEVYNMPGGIKGWQERVATGAMAVGLEIFTGDEEYADGAAMAYAMEDGLQQFYLALAARSEVAVKKTIFTRLAGFEGLHKTRLLAEFGHPHGADTAMPTSPSMVEGGYKLEELLNQVGGQHRDLAAILNLAMAMETQALDLYSRMAHQSNRPATKAFFLAMADEEKGHLGYLAQELDRVLAGSGVERP